MPEPSPITLRDLVNEVIGQNAGIGYYPGRFRQETKAE